MNQQSSGVESREQPTVKFNLDFLSKLMTELETPLDLTPQPSTLLKSCRPDMWLHFSGGAGQVKWKVTVLPLVTI